MALVDFCRLADLYKLRHPDVCFLPIPSHPLLMSTSPPPPSVGSDGAPPPRPPTQVYPETPRKDRSPSPRVQSAPQSHGGDTDRNEGYVRGDYEEYIHEDLNSRVFVDFEVFMRSVLHVPDDWKTKWKSDIEAVKADPKFREHHDEYCRRCEQKGALEKSFYGSFVDTASTALDVASQSSELGVSGTPQYYAVNDPKRLRGGVINKLRLSPDIVVLHESCQPSKPGGLHWANALHILEVKPFDNALCEGRNMPRLVVNGVDPISNHAVPHHPRRWKVKKPPPLATSTTAPKSSSHKPPLPTTSTAREPTSSKLGPKKRAAEEPEINDKPQKRSKTMSRIVGSAETADDGTSAAVQESDEDSSTPITETQTQMSPAMQVSYYLLEMFSVPLLRSHATVGLVDRDRLQLYHANRSVILVSSAINFSKGDGVDKFIAVIIAFRRLSFKQNGVIDGIVDKNGVLTRETNISDNDKAVWENHKLEFTSGGETFKVTLGDVISRDPATIGRSTVVLKATSDKWPGINLAVKISWPGSRRVAENKFVEKAKEEVEKAGQKWAANHLPNILHCEDVDLGKDSTFESIATLFENAQFAEGKNYAYERRTLRIIIQEELNPLKSLTNARDVGQVFTDIACIHRWLYDKPGILHRDPSLNNIMFRRIGGQVYGVLTDYDLSSWTKDLRSDYSKTSQQHTGTPPYMAHELLKGTSAIHLYRHDLEALFYVMLLFCGRHTFETVWDDAAKENKVTRVVMKNEGSLPYRKWFDEQDYEALGEHKHIFLLEKKPIVLSPPFEDFFQWLEDIRFFLSKGFKDKLSTPKETVPQWKLDQTGASAGGDNVSSSSFNDETLGGAVNYPIVINPVPYLKGKLERLVVRYPA